jgi:two-component system, OmpR family, manganese sensing sensor histidine kinase
MFSRSRLNLSSWFAASMGSILMVFAGIVYYFEVEDRLESFDLELAKKSKAIAAKSQYQLQQGQWQLEFPEVPLLATNTSSDDEPIYVRWYNPEGQLLQFVGLPTNARIRIKGKTKFETIQLDTSEANGTSTKQKLRQVTIPVLDNSLLIGYLQIATSLTSLEESLNRTLIYLTLGVPVTLSFIGLTGWFLGGIAMKPIQESYVQLQRFTADASHELRSPLTAILSNTQVALMPSLQNTSEQRVCLEDIEQAAKSMSELINNLLFLARHEGQLTPAVLERINIVELLRSQVNFYAPRAKKMSRNLESDLPSNPVFLRANSELLQRAIANLLDNALKYTSPGGIIRVKLFTLSSPRRTIIQVEDNGIGIPPEDLPHIFERFYRIDTSRSRQTGGFGLGLSIVQQILEAHGAQITVKSVLAQGTTFQIYLPIDKQD